MRTEDIIGFILKVHEATNKGRLRWEKTANENAFQTTIGGYVVRIYLGHDPGDGSDDYSLNLLNTEGEIVDAFDYHNVKKEGFSMYGKLSEIYEMARRSAMGTDKAIKSIIKAIDELPSF